MSKIVIGSSDFRLLSSFEVCQLMETAITSGVKEIDTAPLYGDAEIKIGKNLAKFPDFIVNSKVGLPMPELFGPNRIRNQVEQSLINLRVERIDTIFIHSLPMNNISFESFELLKKLKYEGKIANIGYSGDNENLELAIKSNQFDSYMLSLNILDMSNLEFLTESAKSKRIYVKRTIGNAVWNASTFQKMLHIFHYALGYGRAHDPQTYLFRFRKLKGPLKLREPYIEEFLNFPLSLDFIDRFVIGVTKINHLSQILEMENNLIRHTAEEVEQKIEIWKAKNIYNWKALR